MSLLTMKWDPDHLDALAAHLNLFFKDQKNDIDGFIKIIPNQEDSKIISRNQIKF